VAFSSRVSVPCFQVSTEVQTGSALTRDDLGGRIPAVGRLRTMMEPQVNHSLSLMVAPFGGQAPVSHLTELPSGDP
jgi:hypothetical protein